MAHAITTKVNRPENEQDFEKMCLKIYGTLLGDPTPTLNGRRGQTQGGVDVFVEPPSSGRIGIQCKKFYKTKVTLKTVKDEIKRADDAGTQINKLIVAATSDADAKLTAEVNKLSDEREKQGKFKVRINFWDDIETHIQTNPDLQRVYAPTTPGGALSQMMEYWEHFSANFPDIPPDQLAKSTDVASYAKTAVAGLIESGLDKADSLIREGKFDDALRSLDQIGQDLAAHSDHQRGMWHLLKASATWLKGGNDPLAISLFRTAADIYDNDDRILAGKARAFLLSGEHPQAVETAQEHLKRFPSSRQLWIVYLNGLVAQNEPIDLRSVPPEVTEHPDISHLLAIAADQGCVEGNPVEFAKKAAAESSASVFSKFTMLRLAVQQAGEDPVSAMEGTLPTERYDDLRYGIALFEPLQRTLWNTQSEVVPSVVAVLGMAHLLLGNPEKSIELITQANAHGIQTAETLRIHIQSLSEEKRHDEVVELAQSRVGELSSEAMIISAESALFLRNREFIDIAIKETDQWDRQDPLVNTTLRVIRWLILARTGECKAVALELPSMHTIEAEGDFSLACGAARALASCDHKDESLKWASLAEKIAPSESGKLERLLLADVFYSIGSWNKAAKFYKELAPADRLSDIGAKFLTSLVKADDRKRAKKFLQGLPEQWVHDARYRGPAIELGQNAGDWAFLAELANTQLAAHPNTASSWLFKLYVDLNSADTDGLRRTISAVPTSLDGIWNEIADIANIELANGHVGEGIRRLYYLYRQDIDDPKRAERYLVSILLAPHGIGDADKEVSEVGPGCAVKIKDDSGRETRIIIDPSDMPGITERKGFLSPDSEDAKNLYSLTVGSATAGRNGDGPDLGKYHVSHIETAFLGLFRIAQEEAASFYGLPNIKSVHLPKTDKGEPDLSRIQAQLDRRSRTIEEILSYYENRAITLGVLGRLLHISPIDLLLGWSDEGPSLFVDDGRREHRNRAREILNTRKSRYVIDSATLAFFVKHNLQDRLPRLGELLISATSKQAIQGFLDEAVNDRAFGTMFSDNGKIKILERDEAFKRDRIEFATKLQSAANDVCTESPCYGTWPEIEDGGRLKMVLPSEDYESLLLAYESDAILLTIDGLLRGLAKSTLDLEGVWPEVVIRHLEMVDQVTKNKRSSVIMSEFLSNHRFIGIDAHDVLWMTLQGAGVFRQGVKKVQELLENPNTNFEDTASVAFDYFELLISRGGVPIAIAEIISRLTAALFSHPNCPAGFRDIVKVQLGNAVNRSILPLSVFSAHVGYSNEVRQSLTHLYSFAVDVAWDQQNSPALKEAMSAKMVFGFRSPKLIATRTRSEVEKT